MPTLVGINGFGRIGRLALRLVKDRKDIRVVAINSRAPASTQAHLLKYDSTYGTYQGSVEVIDEDTIAVDGNTIYMFRDNDPGEIPWDKAGAQIVLESTGVFCKCEDAAKHLHGSVKKVVISAPAKGEIDGTFCMGVNEKTYDPKKQHVISNASCTTNCLAPVAKVLNDAFGIDHGLLTTIHSYTSDQQLLDKTHKDLRRARTAGVSMIPTTTGAAKAVGLVIPELKGRLNGIAVRVPTTTVSLVDFVCVVKKPVTIEQVNDAFIKTSTGNLKGILGVEKLPLVSVDYKGDLRSSIVDLMSTDVSAGTLVKVLAWYDNEAGYASRCLDLIMYIGKTL